MRVLKDVINLASEKRRASETVRLREYYRSRFVPEWQALNEQLVRYRKTPEAATKLVSIGARPRDPKLDAPELAAYTTVREGLAAALK